MLIIYFKSRYFLATFWCCLFIVCVQRWNRGCYSSEICSVSLRLLWEDLKGEDWWRLLYQEVKWGRAGLSVAAYWRALCLLLEQEHLLCLPLRHCDNTKKRKVLNHWVYLSPYACVNTCQIKWFLKMNMNCKANTLLLVTFMAKLKAFFGIWTPYFADTDHKVWTHSFI